MIPKFFLSLFPLLLFPLLPAQELTFENVNVDLSDADRQILEAFVRHMAAFPETLDTEKLRQQLKTKGPEVFCWVEFKYLGGLLTSCELTGDTAYLDLFKDAFAHFESIIETGPDEYLGWYGPTLKDRQPKDNPGLEVDEIQTNFRAIGMLTRWIELARADEAYAAANTETETRYLTLMEEHLFPKWDERGHFEVIPGRGGVYRWLDYPIREGVSLSFEKLSIMVEGLLGLHRVTGDPAYMKRALQIGAWYKTNLILKDGHYEWMSWVPGGEWDIHPDKENAWRVGWMAPDPNAGWYVTSLSIALNLYRHDLLFTDEDLQRFVKTQKEMCWNGDMENPEYRTVSAGTGKWVKGRFLSPTIANYDAELKKLAFDGPHEAQQLESIDSSWKGGVTAELYIREKFLLQDQPKPYQAFGENFLLDPGAQPFLDQIDRPVHEGDAVPPRTPDLWYIQP